MHMKDKKIHFMGVGGIGVSALACMAENAGAHVSGCDRQESTVTQMLRYKGIEISIGHEAKHAFGIDLLVYSSAVPENHPERLAATKQERRGAFLARFLNDAEAWGVAGTHGKTTTSWLLAHILIHAGLDPSVFIGGIVPDLPEKNFRIGTGPFVAELDESDAAFLLPELRVAVITNIESDHLSHYGNDAALFSAFKHYAQGVAGSGLLVAGLDSPVCRKIFTAHAGKKVSFGMTSEATIYADSPCQDGGGSRFNLVWRGNDLGEFRIGLPGRHNIQNALAAAAAALEMGVFSGDVKAALAVARGVERRMENVGEFGGAVVYSDYAHHPTEVAAAITAFRQRHPGPTLAVFQPHLYSRTRDYADQFAEALSGADRLLLVDIYPAREEAVLGIDGSLLRPSSGPSLVEGPIPVDKVEGELNRLADGCEAILMMGAGDIDAVARRVVKVQ